MGIYSNGKIYGIKIYNFNEYDISNILFEEKYDTIMSHNQIREAYFFYSNLDDEIKENVRFQIYTECVSTLDQINKDPVMMWYPLSLETFLDIFSL